MDAYIGFYILHFRNKGRSVHSCTFHCPWEGLTALNMVKQHPESAWASCANCNQEGSAGNCIQGDKNPEERQCWCPSPRAAGWVQHLHVGMSALSSRGWTGASPLKVLEQLRDLLSIRFCEAVIYYCQLGRN